MPTSKVYTATTINFTIDQISSRPEPSKVLMCSPEYFQVVDVKNVHMLQHQGQVNTAVAQKQWTALKSNYEKLVNENYLAEVLVIPGAEDCEDMVFAANQSFPWLTTSGERVVVMSKMYHASRAREVAHFELFYQNKGYKIIHLRHTDFFEGMGDTIPHPQKRLLYGGYGHRSTQEAYTELSQLLEVPIVALSLTDERFYHLDTCFLPVNVDTVLLCAEAFDAEGLQAIGLLFKNVVEIPVAEATDFFALNAHIVWGKGESTPVAILQSGATITAAILKQLGVEVKFRETSEFMKSGGSVFCMKMMLY